MKTKPANIIFIAFATVIFLAPLAIRAASSPSAPDQTPAAKPNEAEDVVQMKMFEVVANRVVGKFNNSNKSTWRYARTGDFEILNALDDDYMAGDIMQKALQIIDMFKAASPLFRFNHELPTKIILIKDQDVSKFITAIDKKAGAKIEANSRIFTQTSKRPEIQGLKSGTYNPSQTILCWAKNNDEQSQILMYIPAAREGNLNNYYPVSNLVDAYLKFCFQSHHIKPSNLNYTFLGAKILSLAASERSFTPSHSTGNIMTPATLWYLLAGSEVLIRRYDYKREQVIFQNASSDYAKSESKHAILSKFMAAPSLALRDVLEHPGKFRISYDESNSMQAVETYITYKREISDFSIYCIFSHDVQIRAGYVKLLNATREEPLSEDLFIKCFGKNYKDFYDGMYAFYRSLGKDNYTGKINAWGAPQFSISLPKGKPQPRPDFQGATLGKRASVFAEWFQACNAPGLAEKIYAKAQESDPSVNTDPEFLASLGLYKASAGDKAAALSLLERAAALGTKRPAALRTLQALRQGTPLPREAATPDSE